MTGVNSFDLPQEIHWEYAACGGTQTIWNNGMTDEATQDKNTALPLIARTKYTGGWGWNLADAVQPNGDVDTARGTAEVGSYFPNAYGLYDCHGNVGEWCLDRYLDWKEVTDDYLMSGNTTVDKEQRVVKGSDWYSGVPNQKVDRRSSVACDKKQIPSTPAGTLGFRFYHAAE